MTLEFGLQLSRFDWDGHPAATARTLAGVARAAEEAGFTSLWVMDHFCRSRRSGASGRTCSRATRRSATWPA